MKSVRLSLFALAAATVLFGASACLSESDGDGLNPQPLPPATNEPPPETPGGQFGGDKNSGATGGSSSGGDAPAPSDAASDAGAHDAGKMRYEIKVW